MSSHAASLFWLFEAMTQWPVVEKIVRLPLGAPMGSTKSHLNGRFSARNAETREGSSWMKPILPALKSEMAASRSYCPTGGCDLSLRTRSTEACSAAACPELLNVTDF